MKRIFYSFIIAVGIVGIFLLFQKYYNQHEEPHVHYHAGFVVYIDGVRQDFSASQYMHIDMCSIDKKQQTNSMQKADRAHLHNNIGDVAHIHAEAVTWRELFENAHITLPTDKSLITYQNGKKFDRNIFDTVISPYESIILMYGEPIEITPESFISKTYIEEVEKQPSGCEK